MKFQRKNWTLLRVFSSKTAIAIPVTFLILFVSMLGIISITYYFSIEKVNAKSQTLKVSTAKQEFLSLDEAVLSSLWQTGSAQTLNFADAGGQLNVQPSENSLLISVTDNQNLNENIFNQTVGQIMYELPYSQSSDMGLYLKGDSQTITKDSGSVMTQLYITRGLEHPEIMLRYRPEVSFATFGMENNKLVTNVRIYVINLNSSTEITSYGKLPIIISCVSTQLAKQTFELSSQSNILSVHSSQNGINGQVSIPISSAPEGAIVNIETVLCNIQINRWIR